MLENIPRIEEFSLLHIKYSSEILIFSKKTQIFSLSYLECQDLRKFVTSETNTKIPALSTLKAKRQNSNLANYFSLKKPIVYYSLFFANSRIVLVFSFLHHFEKKIGDFKIC